jgi:transcriptional regulator with XRE-family HTH domain
VGEEHAIDAQTTRLGARIRDLRRGRSLTLAQLAELADLSHPFLSQVERGLARASMGSLDRILHALGSSQVELYASLDDEQRFAGQPAVTVTRAADGTHAKYGLTDGRMLVHGSRRFVPVEIASRITDFGEYFRHDEDEWVYAIDGRVAIDLEGKPLTILESGDSIYFAGGIGHRWASPDGAPYRAITIKEARRS